MPLVVSFCCCASDEGDRVEVMMGDTGSGILRRL